MTDEDKKALVAAITGELEDSCGIGTVTDRDLTARLIADRIGSTLWQQGWMPPATYERVSDWAAQTGSLPEHHINKSVLGSQLIELSDILHDR